MVSDVVQRPKLLYLVSEDWYFVSHRLPLAIAAKAEGFDVTVVTRVAEHGILIRDAGLNLIPLAFSRSGLNPFPEARSLIDIRGHYRNVRPELVHNVALKPVIYGSIAARHTHVKGTVNALMGLGWIFSSDSRKARALRPLVRTALRHALTGQGKRVIVQNKDDAELLVAHGLAPADAIRLIRGSGVDPAKYPTADPSPGIPLVVLPARMLVDKGVVEFMQAAAMLKSEGVVARFALVGQPDAVNPAAIAPELIESFVRAGHVEYWGWREDMPRVLSEASLVCLPSYREGLPKALLEAAASARAIVATDVPGCREIVRPGENGWLVPPRNAAALAAALKDAIARPDLRAHYGAAGRRLVEREFSLASVIEQTLAVYRELMRPV
jgi:glycosyltransferase involved in cell wall biosynthesis